jgi:small subunit ribosomal protein S15
MYLTKETKAEIFAKHGGKAENTGSAEGQIALFTSQNFSLNRALEKKSSRLQHRAFVSFISR